MYAVKTLLDNRLRLILTVLGIALCTVLMLLLLSIYKGVADGSVEYIRRSRADLWVLQRHCYNILRSNSYLTMNHGRAIEKIEGVKSVSPVFFLLASIDLPENKPTLYLTGYNSGSGMGGPPEIIKGSYLQKENEIIIDRSFSKKYGIRIGDKLPLKNDTLIVAGLSGGTNMFVIQYAFIDLKKAFDIAGIKNYVSCFLVELDDNANKKTISSRIENKFGDTSVFDSETFLENNIREMESGLLPLLYAVALISAIVLTAVLSLILTINVLERRNDYATMKALGAPGGFIPGLVMTQAVFLSTSGLICGIFLFFPFAEIIERLSPEVSAHSSLIHILLIAFVVEFLSIISSALPNYRLRTIYPLEVFR